MAETTVVDESTSLLLSVYEFCLYAVRHFSEASCRGSRGLVWGLIRRLGGKINRAVALGDLCGRLFRILANEALDVAVGERLCVAGGG